MFFANKRICARFVRLAPDEFPRPILMREGLIPAVGVMFHKAAVGFITRPDVEFPRGILKNIDPIQTRQVGLEPTTSRLTAGCSTIELLPKISNRHGNAAG